MRLSLTPSTFDDVDALIGRRWGGGHPRVPVNTVEMDSGFHIEASTNPGCAALFAMAAANYNPAPVKAPDVTRIPVPAQFAYSA